MIIVLTNSQIEINIRIIKAYLYVFLKLLKTYLTPSVIISAKGNQRIKSCLSKFVSIERERVKEVITTNKYLLDFSLIHLNMPKINKNIAKKGNFARFWFLTGISLGWNAKK